MTKTTFDSTVHKRVLITLLIAIMKELGHKVAFKGGTAAMLFYSLPRMSRDLDFDIRIPLSDADKEILNRIISAQGTIKESHEKRFTLFYLFNYEHGSPNVKLEFNKRASSLDTYKEVWLLGVPMSITDETTAATNKLLALTERATAVARDLFDVHYFLTIGYPINEKLIIQRTHKTLPEYVSFAAAFIEKTYTPKNVLSGVGELLDEKQKQWTKIYLIPETMAELKKYADNLRS